ncbi:pirin family protein, partial [Pseudomonas syringae pv. tagetis]
MVGLPLDPLGGFDSVCYLLEGRMLHDDHMGNVGLLQGGGVLWMTAARGLIHCVMPDQEVGSLRGFQLWVN